MDAHATVTVGPFARGGKSRIQVEAADHDGAPEATRTPVGLFLPPLGALCVDGGTATVTRDGLVDRLVQWWEAVRERCAPLTTLVSTGENGPENQSRRTQWMQRRVAFVQQYRVTIRLAYSPPSHSTSNPIERCWGILEHHGHGTVLDAIDTVLPCARTMTWHGTHPIVPLVTPTYQTGVTWTKDAMETVEAQLKRLPNLGTWFVDIVSSPPAIRDTSLFLSPLFDGPRSAEPPRNQGMF